MVKKIFLVVLLLLALAACGTNPLDPDSATVTPVPQTEEPPATIVPTPIPTPIPTPAAIVEAPIEYCYILGGRLWPDEVGYEYVASVDKAWLVNGGPLQQFYSQVVADETVLPADLETDAEFEVVNDGVQAVVCGKSAYITARDPWPPAESDGDVLFLEVSWMRWTDSGLRVCEHDTGGPGEWVGVCSGDMDTIVVEVDVDYLFSLKDFQHYAAPYEAAVSNTIAPTQEKAIVLEAVFTKSADPSSVTD